MPHAVKTKTSKAQSGTNAPLVVKLGGAAIERAGDFPELFRAIAELHRGEVERGGGLVLVHGGGSAIDRRLERLGLTSERRDGIRITPPEHIDEIVAVLDGIVNKELVGQLQRHGAAAVGLCLGDGLLIRAVKARSYQFDPGCVGEIDGGDPKIIQTLLGAGFLPVLSSIGLDTDGEPLNINADDAAAGLAGLLQARGLVLLTDVPGVLNGQGELTPRMTTGEVERRIEEGVITGGMIVKVRGAARAAQTSGSPVTIAAWNDPAVFAKLANGAAAGTQIVAEAKATAPSGRRLRPATRQTPGKPRS